MKATTRKWKLLFLFGAGLALGSAFCMKWMESDLRIGNETFTILGLELFYTKAKLVEIFSRMSEHVRSVLSYHLHFDFAFMAGAYPAIAALCMTAKEKVYTLTLRRILHVLAFLQLLAWAADIAENVYLLKWIEHPAVGNEFGLYHFVVIAKWAIAVLGVLIAGIVLLLRRRQFRIQNSE
jgi:hypothetical protein